MDYLREHNMLNSLITLEKEAQVSLFKYGKELTFLRGLIIDGSWSDAESFIKTIFENLAADTNIGVNVPGGAASDEYQRTKLQNN